MLEQVYIHDVPYIVLNELFMFNIYTYIYIYEFKKIQYIINSNIINIIYKKKKNEQKIDFFFK